MAEKVLPPRSNMERLADAKASLVSALRASGDVRGSAIAASGDGIATLSITPEGRWVHKSPGNYIAPQHPLTIAGVLHLHQITVNPSFREMSADERIAFLKANEDRLAGEVTGTIEAQEKKLEEARAKAKLKP